MSEKLFKSRNFLEKMAGWFPGYKGYKEKELRRETDKILRDRIAQRIDSIRKHVTRLTARLSENGALEYMNEMGRVIKLLEGIRDRIKFATYGYAGFFALHTIKEDELDRIYSFDMEIVNLIEKLESVIDNVDMERLEAFIKSLEKVIDDIEERWAEREILIKGGSDGIN